MYLDLFDSTKSGHPISADTKDEWWRSNNNDSQDDAIQLAHAGMIMRLLYGDTIVLTHNQIVDSVAFLRAVQKMSDSLARFPHVPFTWAAYNTEPTPEAFISTVEGIFRPKQPDPVRSQLKQFKFSAWAGLTDKMRIQIADNLKDKKSFKFMLDGVLKDVNPKLQTMFGEQAEALHYFDLYLRNNYTNSDWSVDGPTVIKPSEVGVKKSIWEDLNSLRDMTDGIPSSVLDNIVKKIGIFNVEIRSALYEGITDEPDEIRERVKDYIDRFYNEKNGASATGGRGIFTIMDQNPQTAPSDDEKYDSLADSVNSIDGREGKIILHQLPQEYKGLSAITLDDCIRILRLPKIQNNITQMHLWVRQLQELRKDNQLVNSGDYRNISENLHKAIDVHETDLAKELEKEIKINNGTLWALVKPASLLSVAGGIEVAKGLISIAINTQPYWTQAATNFGVGILGEIIPDLVEKRMKITAAGTIRQSLRKASPRNFF